MHANVSHSSLNPRPEWGYSGPAKCKNYAQWGGEKVIIIKFIIIACQYQSMGNGFFEIYKYKYLFPQSSFPLSPGWWWRGANSDSSGRTTAAITKEQICSINIYNYYSCRNPFTPTKYRNTWSKTISEIWIRALVSLIASLYIVQLPTTPSMFHSPGLGMGLSEMLTTEQHVLDCRKVKPDLSR